MPDRIIHPLKEVVETITVPAGITVSGLTFFGVSLSDWVFIGTALLVICNLTLTIPKVFRSLRGD